MERAYVRALVTLILNEHREEQSKRDTRVAIP